MRGGQGTQRQPALAEINLHISNFDYRLPPEAIAQQPLAERDESRLLTLPRHEGPAAHNLFKDLPGLLSPGDLLVVNRSRVLPARLLCNRATGGRVELLLLRQVSESSWEAWARPGGRLKQGEELAAAGLSIRIDSDPLEPDGRRRVTPLCDSADFVRLIERIGHIPLPPYIRREDTPDDRDRYQTIFAKETGSVAAPTAGLHFSDSLLDALHAHDIAIAEIVLHVGPGTFQPVRVEDVNEHRVAPEPYEVPAETAHAIKRTRENRGRVVAVGTTVVRTLETAAMEASAASPSPQPSPPGGERGAIQTGSGETDLVIVPGFEFKVVDALITNFHLPRSSLLLLVSAFAGRERVLGAYAEALEKGYRFYSYGDALLIL